MCCIRIVLLCHQPLVVQYVFEGLAGKAAGRQNKTVSLNTKEITGKGSLEQKNNTLPATPVVVEILCAVHQLLLRLGDRR